MSNELSQELPLRPRRGNLAKELRATWEPEGPCPDCGSPKIQYGGPAGGSVHMYFCRHCLAEWDHNFQTHRTFYVDWTNY